LPRANEPTERTCVVTREAKPVAELIRFVAAPDGSIVPDIKRKLPGRGVWVTGEREKVALAVKKHHLERALEGGVRAPADLADQVDNLLLSAAAGALALARKAGGLLGGFGKVEKALASEDVIALVHATEAAPDGVAKLRSAAVRRFGEQGVPSVRVFGTDQLDLAFGMSNVVHAALLAGPAGANVLARVQDLVRYRGGETPPTSSFGRSFDALTEVNDLSAGP
jgi:predicted RNA-binding protein YlxR (DUF448 family)